MKEDPLKGIWGAVVLEDRYDIGDHKLVRSMRIRILSDQGREAANLYLFLGESPKIKGHTIYPGGKIITFDGLRDFSTKPLVETSRFELKRTAVVPPGINGNCVLEVQWEEPPLGQGHGRYIRYLGGKFAVLRTIVDVTKGLSRSHQVIPGRGIQSELTEEPKAKRFTLMNLPPREGIPYGLAVTRDLPRIVVFNQQVTRSLSKRFKQAKGPRERADIFWSDYVEEDLRGQFEKGWHTGSTYKAFRDALFVGLPETPHARASALLTRLNARLRNREASTFAEVAADKGIKNLSDWLDYVNSFRAFNLETMAQLRITTKAGMRSMYFYLLKEAGLIPLIGLVVDRDILLFDYNTLDANQFTHELFGIEEAGRGILWLDPTLRFATPGLIPSEYQGTAGLMVDSGNWKASPFTVPVQPALANQCQFHYQVSLDDDGESFAVVAEFSGIPEYEERNRFFIYDNAGQTRILKEGLESRIKNLVLTKAEVLNAQDSLNNISWKVAGQIETAPSRVREVMPFPAMPSPLWIPDSFPSQRHEPILMPYCSTHLAVAHIEVPAGYHYEPGTPFSHTNRFGSVHWLAAPETKNGRSSVKALLRVDVTGFYEKPEAYDDFKAFLGWVREATGRTVKLERTR